MLTKKIIITKKHFNMMIKDILIDLNINPETVLVKIKDKFTPISYVIKKKTELEVLEVIKV